ncbi:MAG: hypothetical protein NT121_09600 [Chloroflexi bacterium]|nr:hypothetical protein [Chloroflexota bacterium]
MNLIDRYVTEVGKRLPRKSRADIETEIRSTLEDMLEENAAKVGRPADDEMVKKLLVDYGAPDKVAATYQPERYLIGPKMFPIFMLVFKIVASVLTVLAVVGFGVRFSASDLSLQSFGSQLAKTMLEYFGGMLSAFGNMVLVFAILERFLPKSEYENELNDQGWDPADLMNEPEPDEVSSWEPIMTIVFTLLGLSLLNFYPQGLSIFYFAGSTNVFIPALSEAFFRMLPWINITAVLSIILNISLLRSGRWTPATRWFEIGLKIAGIVITYALLKGPSILAIDAAALAQAPMDATTAATMAGLLSQLTSIGLAIAVIVGGIEVARGIYTLLIKPAQSKPITVK